MSRKLRLIAILAFALLGTRAGATPLQRNYLGKVSGLGVRTVDVKVGRKTYSMRRTIFENPNSLRPGDRVKIPASEFEKVARDPSRSEP